MKQTGRSLLVTALLFCAVAGVTGPAWAAPRLRISPFGFQVNQIQPVPGNPGAFDITSRAGVCGDAATGVSARLTSASARFVVLDGDVRFGDVARASCLRPIPSEDTFSLRVILPQSRTHSEVRLFVLALFQALSWTLTCDTCGSNRPPVADAGPDQTSRVGQLVTLDGTGSTDSDGQPLTYAWTIVVQPPGSAAELAGASTVHPTFAPDREGEYVVQLVVSDGQLASAPDTLRIDTVNSPPVANAGPDQTAYVGQPVSLDGSGSTDVDGDPLSYSWSVAARPAGSGAEVENPTESAAGFTADVPGQYVIELLVHDGTAASAPDVVIISTLNSRPVADAGPDQTAYVAETVLLDGSRSIDADGDPLSFRWSLLSVPPGSSAILDDTSSVGPAFTLDRPGTYVAQLIVNDGTADSEADTVVVSTLNSRPRADAGPSQGVHWNSVVLLDGTASIDADGDPLVFSWSMLSRPVGSDSVLVDAGTPQPSLRADRPGQYVVQLIVNDGTIESAPATVAIAATNQPPVALDDSARTAGGAAVDIDVLGNDRDADGDALELASVSPPTHGTTALIDGRVRYTPEDGFGGTDAFLYTVTDGADSANATVTVEVAANAAPVANGDAAVGLRGQVLPIAVLANDFDADGDTLSIASVTQPDIGSVVTDGAFVTFTPPAGFVGSTGFTYVVSDGRGGSASASVTVRIVPPQPGPIARLELSPSAVLLTALNEPRALEVHAFDASGAPIPFFGYETIEFLSSNDEDIPVSGGGAVEALEVPASALVRVRLLADPTVVSPPVLVTAADLTTREQVVVLLDEEIVDDPLLLDATDRRYQVTLTRGLEAGTLILGSGGKAVLGRVASVDPVAGDGSYRTEVRLVPLTTIFDNLTLSYSFTPEELSPLIQEEAPLRSAAKTVESPNRHAPMAPPTDASPSSGACSLEFSSTELTAGLQGNVTPSLGFDLDLAIAGGTLERFKMLTSGSLDATLKLTASIGAAVEAEGSCKKRIASVLIPIGGPLSLLIGARVPIGFSGSLGLSVQQNLANVEIEQTIQAAMVLGVSYQNGQGFLPVNVLSLDATTLDPVVNVPASALRFRGKAFLGGTAGISLGVLGFGEPLFELASLRGGPEFEARFGEPYDVSTDSAYHAGYDLKLVGRAGPGADLTDAFKEIFDTIPVSIDTSVRVESPWASSPKAGAVMKADRAEFAAGDTVTFRVDLDPGSAYFPFLGYNVSEIRIYLRDEASSTARLIASTLAAPDQFGFELAWTADRDGRATNPTSGTDNFFAFAVPSLLATPSNSYPLELGPVPGTAPIEILPREVTLPTGGTRQFRARIDGQDATSVRWTATGGTISSTGFFQAGVTPGEYTVTVARLDEPGVYDEATVEVRPQCAPGTNDYCGFSYASQFWPGSTTWGNSAINDNGDWVGLLFDAAQPRDARNPPLVFFGRGNSYQLVSGLNNGSIDVYFPRNRNFQGQGYFKLTNSGAFAGCYGNFMGSGGGAFVSQNGVTRFLDPLPGDELACAWDVSEDLVVVGLSQSPLGLGMRAVRWVNGVVEDLGLGAGSLAISPDGRILFNSLSDGILVWQDGAVTTLPNSGDCVGRDINANGDVVGTCVTGGSVVWKNGVREPLGESDHPYAINDVGDILATSFVGAGYVEVLWRHGVRNVIENGSYVDGPPAHITSISRTKSLLGGYGVACTGNNCRSYIWTGYPVELVLP